MFLLIVFNESRLYNHVLESYATSILKLISIDISLQFSWCPVLARTDEHLTYTFDVKSKHKRTDSVFRRNRTDSNPHDNRIACIFFYIPDSTRPNGRSIYQCWICMVFAIAVEELYLLPPKAPEPKRVPLSATSFLKRNSKQTCLRNSRQMPLSGYTIAK